MSLANLSMCSETHSGFIGKISWVSLCSRAPGGCLGASGQAGEVATEPLPACYRGGASPSCTINRLSTLGKTPPSPSLSFPSYKWDGRDAG